MQDTGYWIIDAGKPLFYIDEIPIFFTTVEFMETHYFDNTTKAGTTAGTLLTIFANIHSGDLVKTAILAAIGAAVSFCITLLLKFLIKSLKK